MDAAIRDKWAALLESGRYRQTTGALRRGKGFCCLGVLCELFREETGEGKWERIRSDTGTIYGFVARGTEDSRLLPVAVSRWAGLNDVNPELRPGAPDHGVASILNDNGIPFAHIADFIRQLPATEA